MWGEIEQIEGTIFQGEKDGEWRRNHYSRYYIKLYIYHLRRIIGSNDISNKREILILPPLETR